MNYLKAGLAGFGMSFIGTALCGSKVGSAELSGYCGKIKKDVYYEIIDKNQEKLGIKQDFLTDFYNNYNLKYNSTKKQLDFSEFKYDEYYNDYLKQNESNLWFNKDGSSIATPFLINNLWCNSYFSSGSSLPQ